jgi:hypothetical protein
MKVLVSKYELRSVEERWPDFESCPDYVEVACIFPPVADLTPDQKIRLRKGIEAGISKKKAKPKSKRSKIS